MPRNKSKQKTTKKAAQNKTGAATILPPVARINYVILNNYRNTLSNPIKEIYDLLYNLLLEIGQATNYSLIRGDLATFCGFDQNGQFTNSNIDWNKLTYFIAFRAPFNNANYTKYFVNIPPVALNASPGNWYKKANDIRLKYWELHNGILTAASFPLDIKRLCLNGEQEIYTGSFSSITDGVNPIPIPIKRSKRSDYELFIDVNSPYTVNNNNLYFYSELKDSPEFYFGNTPTSTNPNDDSNIEFCYYLVAHFENPFNTVFWKHPTHPSSRPHFPGDPNSGLTLGFGIDLGHCGISNYSLNNDSSTNDDNIPDALPTSPNLPNPNHVEFTLNYFLLTISQQWRNYLSTDKQKVYKANIRYTSSTNDNDRNATGSLNKSETIAKLGADLDVVKSLELGYDATTNPIGGYKKCIEATIEFWERYYFSGATNLTSVEKSNGLPQPKILKNLKDRGLKTALNVIEKYAILAIGYNGPGAISSNAYDLFVSAINAHSYSKLLDAVKACASWSKSKPNVIKFLNEQRVKNYYINTHFNNI